MNSLKAIIGLEEVAKLRSDIEMKKFSIFRAKVVAAQTRRSQLQDRLQGLYDVTDAFSVQEAMLTSALTTEALRMIAREDSYLQRMLPAFELARSSATKEFARLQVLGGLRDELGKRTSLNSKLQTQ